MRVLQLTDKTASSGGIGTYVEMVSSGLRQRGHDVQCIRLLANNFISTTTDQNIEWRMPQSYHALTALPQIHHWRKLLFRLRPDIIHIHAGFTSLSPLLLSYLKKNYRVVATLHDVRPFCPRGSRRFKNTEDICERVVGTDCIASDCLPEGGGESEVYFDC